MRFLHPGQAYAAKFLVVPEQRWVGTGPCCIVKAEGRLCLAFDRQQAKLHVSSRTPLLSRVDQVAFLTGEYLLDAIEKLDCSRRANVNTLAQKLRDLQDRAGAGKRHPRGGLRAQQAAGFTKPGKSSPGPWAGLSCTRRLCRMRRSSAPYRLHAICRASADPPERLAGPPARSGSGTTPAQSR